MVVDGSHTHAPDGCGMSTRPEYYSGRGAITSDLNDTSLEKLWTAEAFVLMVEAIPVLSATDFLITLEALERNNFKWDPRFVSGAKGIDIAREEDGSHNEVSAFCTMAAMFGRGDRDETPHIRNAFLVRHGRKVKTATNVYGDPFGDYGYPTRRWG